ncbi:hypothetical protein E1264_00250 [Actinomadura sp. KC216]|uniref:hypothetical protein n=1 Tax=Actinomadura sp. KC216 TaxID=2530370 RepID=UPI0010477553|nr:hypothetical protein [Actinomadura sp. KC216]TDB91934.1 hypothetical protein E1264_00250 [Actinomadura sp. KC216]
MTHHPAGQAAGAVRVDRGMRLLRAAAFSTVCVSASASAHALASQAGLPWRPLLAGWLVMMCLLTPLAGRAPTRPGIVAMLLCSQTVLHVVFGRGQRHAALTGDDGLPRSAHAVSGHETGPLMGDSLMPGPAMFAVHLAIAALLGWLVHHGDRALWELIRLSRRATGTLTRPLEALLSAILMSLPALPLRLSPVAARPGPEAAPGETVLLHHAVIRRGPPMAA